MIVSGEYTEVTYIYVLTDPRDGEVRYIGKSNAPAKRYQQHLLEARRYNRAVYCWIRKLESLGLEPGMRVIRCCHDWKNAEREAIESARAKGAKLMNIAAGGDDIPCTADGRVSRARTATLKRPKHVMRAYRLLETGIRSMRRYSSPLLNRHIALLARFHASVQRWRSEGRLDVLDQRLGALFALREASHCK